jgi:hypothetical protein
VARGSAHVVALPRPVPSGTLASPASTPASQGTTGGSAPPPARRVAVCSTCRQRSKILFSCSGGIPVPVSDRVRTHSGSSRALQIPASPARALLTGACRRNTVCSVPGPPRANVVRASGIPLFVIWSDPADPSAPRTGPALAAARDDASARKADLLLRSGSGAARLMQDAGAAPLQRDRHRSRPVRRSNSERQ